MNATFAEFLIILGNRCSTNASMTISTHVISKSYDHFLDLQQAMEEWIWQYDNGCGIYNGLIPLVRGHPLRNLTEILMRWADFNWRGGKSNPDNSNPCWLKSHANLNQNLFPLHFRHFNDGRNFQFTCPNEPTNASASMFKSQMLMHPNINTNRTNGQYISQWYSEIYSVYHNEHTVCTCTASSLVGASTRACTSGKPTSICCKIETENVAVLPVPDWAWAITSNPKRKEQVNSIPCILTMQSTHNIPYLSI